MLANIALNGLENAILVDNSNRKNRTQTTRSHSDNKVHLIRYDDDFVILAPHKSDLKDRIKIARAFLETRGLELSKEKCKIVTIFQEFYYLGFNIRKKIYDPKKLNAKTISAKVKVKQSVGYTLIIKPAEKKSKSGKRKNQKNPENEPETPK
jgi:RNA-directed DNA polymerase